MQQGRGLSPVDRGHRLRGAYTGDVFFCVIGLVTGERLFKKLNTLRRELFRKGAGGATCENAFQTLWLNLPIRVAEIHTYVGEQLLKHIYRHEGA